MKVPVALQLHKGDDANECTTVHVPLIVVGVGKVKRTEWSGITVEQPEDVLWVDPTHPKGGV